MGEQTKIMRVMIYEFFVKDDASNISLLDKMDKLLQDPSVPLLSVNHREATESDIHLAKATGVIKDED